MWEPKKNFSKNSLLKDIPSVIHSLGARLPENDKINLKPEGTQLIITKYMTLDFYASVKILIGGPRVILRI